MDGFTFLFEAFVLLMGLAMAEVLGGFARVLKLRARRRAGRENGVAVRIGWLVPLLGIFVIIDQATFFLHMYSLRNHLLFNAGSVIGILFLIGWFYLLSSLVFPDEPEDWPDFDEWYWQQKRWVIGGVLAINVLSTIASLLVIPVEYYAEVAGISSRAYRIGSMVSVLVIPAMIWLLFSRRRRVDIALLTVASLAVVIFGVLTVSEAQPG